MYIVHGGGGGVLSNQIYQMKIANPFIQWDSNMFRNAPTPTYRMNFMLPGKNVKRRKKNEIKWKFKIRYPSIIRYGCQLASLHTHTHTNTNCAFALLEIL